MGVFHVFKTVQMVPNRATHHILYIISYNVYAHFLDDVTYVEKQFNHSRLQLDKLVTNSQFIEIYTIYYSPQNVSTEGQFSSSDLLRTVQKKTRFYLASTFFFTNCIQKYTNKRHNCSSFNSQSDHSYSTYATFSKKLIFFTPWPAKLSVSILSRVPNG